MIDESVLCKSLIKSMGILIIECNFTIDKLEVIGEYPIWYQRIFSQTPKILSQQDLVEGFPFLLNFFDMVSYKLTKPDSVNPESSVWGIDTEQGESFHFVCSLLKLDDTMLLTIKKLDSEFTERQLILHSKRDIQLKYDELEEKQQKIKMDISSIVFDIGFPIEGLRESVGSIYKLALSMGNQNSINIANRQIFKLQALVEELKLIVQKI